jgi:hypothetical protein
LLLGFVTEPATQAAQDGRGRSLAEVPRGVGPALEDLDLGLDRGAAQLERGACRPSDREAGEVHVDAGAGGQLGAGPLRRRPRPTAADIRRAKGDALGERHVGGAQALLLEPRRPALGDGGGEQAAGEQRADDGKAAQPA